MQVPDISQYRLYIENALEHADRVYTFDDVSDAVASGKAQFWPGPNSFIITELVDYPRARHVHVWLAGGNLAEIEAMTAVVSDWARRQGCTRATLTGRRGWERTFLTRTGWTQSSITMERSLEPWHE